MKVYIAPSFRGVDQGDGGIRRNVEAQYKYLSDFDIEVVKLPEQADIIDVHAGLWVETDKPVVSHCHGLYWNEYEWQKWHHNLNQDVISAMRKADVVTAPSEWVANVLRRGMWLDAPVLYHGIDQLEWSPGENLGYVLWNKTRVDPICDYEPLNELVKRAPNERFVSTFGNQAPNLRITGTLPYEEGKELIRNAGVYLCTSRETFGIGTLEAMACGVPVLGWAWGGQSEIVTHRENGWLARPGDYDSLVEGLQYCIANRDRLGKAARDCVLKDFTWRKAISKYVPIYKQLLLRPVGPKVSVVIPCHNLSKYLERAILSVKANKYDDYEIVVVDDFGDDGAEVAAICAKYDAKRIRNMHNLYLAETLNVGIATAQGEYIIPLDADNELGERALPVLADYLDKHRDADIVYGAMKVIEEDGTNFVSGWPQDFDFRKQLAHRNQCPSTSMYRKKVWQRSGGYRRRCRTAEDADFWTRVSSLGFQPRKVTDAVTLVYYNRKDSMSHVEADWDWTAWYPWSKIESLTPFGAIGDNVAVPEPVLVSVIIPVGPGHERLVIDAVDSLVAQTFIKWEAIVVNDSGNDLEWIHPFVRVINTDGRVGPAKARNLGIAASKANTFVLLDADDYLHPTALELLFNAYIKYGGYVYSDWYIAETNKIVMSGDYNCKEILKQMPHAVTGLYPKQAWLDVNGFDETVKAWEDWHWIISLAASGYCGTRVPEPLMYYRMQTGTRRESMFANKEELKLEVLDRWKPYITGEKQLMACGGCGKGGGAKVVSAPVARATRAMPMTDMVLLEYTGTSLGSRTFVGAVTKDKYRFGSDAQHKVKYVNRADAVELLRLKDFKLYDNQEKTENVSVLVASGPPTT